MLYPIHTLVVDIGPIWLGHMSCSGSEFNIFHCQWIKYPYNCTHSEIAGVQCIDESCTAINTPTPASTDNIEATIDV